MILKETTNEAKMISVNGMPPAPFKQRFITYKIRNDKEMVEFHEEVAKGRSVICQIEGKDATYMMAQELIPSKIAMAG